MIIIISIAKKLNIVRRCIVLRSQQTIMLGDIKDNRKRYFRIMLNCSEKSIIKNVWFSAVTEEGLLVFIKAKLKLEEVDNRLKVDLLQQTTYYKGKNGIVALYR